MPPAARLGDRTTHGGTLVHGEPTVLIGSKWAARLGDPHVCPMSDGPKPHVGGAITSASGSVFIGGALAARVGDSCACPSAGTVGVGVPNVIGPGAPPQLISTDPKGRTTAELDEIDDVTGPHAELEITDSDRDGTYDNIRARASAARMRNKAHHDVGGVRFGAEHRMDVGYAEKTAGLSTDDGLPPSTAYREHTDIGMVKEGGSVSVGPAEEGVNPWLKVDAEYGLGTAEGGADLFVGSDGDRHGFSAMGGAEAKAVSGELEAETSIPIPFTDWTIETGLSVEGDAVAFGESGGAAIYYDSGRQRMNWRYKAPIPWLGLDVGLKLSIGNKYPPKRLSGILVRGVAAVNVIVTGDSSVLIG
jgi:uncharacterized Zn-binding protein involved in type VI secretion